MKSKLSINLSREVVSLKGGRCFSGCLRPLLVLLVWASGVVTIVITGMRSWQSTPIVHSMRCFPFPVESTTYKAIRVTVIP